MTAVVEQILVIPRTWMVEQVGEFQGFRRNDADAYKDLLRGAEFRPRPAMEEDPTFKQLIPYQVLMHLAGDELESQYIYAYRRSPKGGESRLHGKRSIGVGGHLNIGDCGGLAPSLAGYLTGLHREITEEVSLQARAHQRFYGLLNDDSDAVGQVHLGLVHLWLMAEPAVQSKEAELADDGFYTLPNLLADIDAFENWSQLVLKHLAETRVTETASTA